MATLLSIGALAVALLAIGYAWKLNRELDTARGRLDRYNRAIFSTEESIRSLRAELESVRRELRIELLKRTGDAHFAPEMTVGEARLLHPRAQQILAGYHLGGCASCAVDDGDTLDAVCQNSGIEPALLLLDLNRLLGSDRLGETHSQGDRDRQPVKIPNVHLDL